MGCKAHSPPVRRATKKILDKVGENVSLTMVKLQQTNKNIKNLPYPCLLNHYQSTLQVLPNNISIMAVCP